MEELWKDIPGYEGLYQASNYGKIKRIKNGRSTFIGKILKPFISYRGYQLVRLYKNKIPKAYSVHRLVLLTWKGPPPNDKSVGRHLDGNKLNNYIENLEWSTQKENIHDKIKHGTNNYANGTKCHNAKLNDQKAKEIRYLYYELGYTAQELSEKFKISKSSIWDVIKYITWKHLL